MGRASCGIGLALLVLLAGPAAPRAAPSGVPDGPAGVEGVIEPAAPSPDGEATDAEPDPAASGPGTGEEGGTVREAESLAAEGRRLYGEGRFAEAVSAYLEAHRLAPSGALLYNIAFLYDKKMAEPDLAMEFYQRCVGSPDSEARIVERASRRLAALRAEKEARTAPIGDGGRDGAPAGGVPRSTWGWVAVGSGAGVLVGGVTLALLAREDHQAYQSSRDLGRKEDLRERGRAMAIAGDVMMAVGAAAVVTGTVLLLLPEHDDRGSVTTTGLRFEPVVLPGGAALMIGGSL